MSAISTKLGNATFQIHFETTQLRKRRFSARTIAGDVLLLISAGYAMYLMGFAPANRATFSFFSWRALSSAHLSLLEPKRSGALKTMTTTETQSKKPLILIVDDDANQRALYEEEMRDEGYEVATAADGREAIQKAGELRPNLVVMDVNMPVMDGLDTLSRLIEADRHVPVIIHTAYASYKDSFASWSADAYIVKSSDLSNLKNSVRDLLAARPSS